MTTKQRAYLKGLAMTMDPIFQVGKASMNPGLTEAIAEALEARELIKISVLKNCMDDPREIAETLAERTQSQVVQVIGKKIVLYKEGKDDKKENSASKIIIFSASELLYDSEAEFEYRKLAERVFHSRKGTGIDNEDWYYGWYI